MKIAVLGLENFSLGKKNLADERIDKLRDLLRTPKTTYIQIELIDESRLKEADGVLCEEKAKLDLILKDLELIELQIAQSKDDSKKDIFLRSKEALEKETLLGEINFNDEERDLLSGLNLITARPLYIVNKESLPGFPQLLFSAYLALNSISFFTANERELRAWSIKKGTTAHEAAGKIHTDIQRGFIKAEVVNCDDIIKSGGLNQAKAKGLLKLEDKDYIVKDGDFIKFKFNI